MAKIGAACVLLVCLWLRASSALPAFEDDRDLDKELYIRQLAEWLADQSTDFLNDLTNFPPCRPCSYEHRQPIAVVPRATYAKRNSELINSLLSLPKTMNDAGK
ncbi:pigment-dispersing hormone peptides [Anopheles funestus]|uniref:pigment-dispersing hormone peptides n=1 Tax=Anopheles funestus TaxID=62324 RepID=UPI0020C60C02|nr:pigment-dispersing hormone peptides [Anopheles funestus]